MATNAQTLINTAIAAGYDKLSDRELKECILAAASSGGGGGVTSVTGTNGVVASPTIGAVVVQKNNFKSAPQSINANHWVFAHGLGVVPNISNALLLCNIADSALGTSVGQEVNTFSIGDNAAISPAFSVTCDATNVYVGCTENPSTESGALLVMAPIGGGGGGAVSASDWNNFTIVSYAEV